MTAEELAQLRRDLETLAARRPASPFDNPEWVALNNQQWHRLRDLAEEFLQTQHDPSEYVKHARSLHRGEKATPDGSVDPDPELG